MDIDLFALTEEHHCQTAQQLVTEIGNCCGYSTNNWKNVRSMSDL